MSRDRSRFTVIVVPGGSSERGTRTYSVRYRTVRVLAVVLVVASLAWVAMAASWWYVAAHAAEVRSLRAEVTALEIERRQLRELARTLERLEARYGQVRVILGADARSADSIWHHFEGEGSGEDMPAERVEGSVPTAWPLIQRGFVTRGHGGGDGADHPGLDVAVAEGSYIRAAGAGRVVETGDDPVYGRFVRIEHNDGYESMYGHASELFVQPAEPVERHQVIALTGSTGRSTAPHLHFEIRRDGVPIDPRSILVSGN